MLISKALAYSCTGIYKLSVVDSKYKGLGIFLSQEILLTSVKNILVMVDGNYVGMGKSVKDILCGFI